MSEIYFELRVVSILNDRKWKFQGFTVVTLSCSSHLISAPNPMPILICI